MNYFHKQHRLVPTVEVHCVFCEVGTVHVNYLDKFKLSKE